MQLEAEIEKSKRLVRTDAYQMSIGEIVNMYKDGELLINPDFQRLFRWEQSQKSKLIESVLLGIPLPPIFVFETQTSKWELIDGLQRVSTLLEFMGLLKNDKKIQPPSIMEATKYLPSLRNSVWEVSDQILGVEVADQQPLSMSQQLAIRRSRLGVEILKRPSDDNTKYDLFQRLNSAGTPANPQEIRNCIIIMINGEYFKFVRAMADSVAFLEVAGVTDEHRERQKNLEYASRFLTHTFVDYDGKLDVEEFIDEGMKELAAAGEQRKAKRVFNGTFKLLHETFGGNSLRRRQANGQHTGRIGLAAFEAIAVGIGRNYDAIIKLKNPNDYIEKKISQFWKSSQIEKFFTPGLRGTIRIDRTIPFGIKWFKP
ncbi:Protein of unknown function DUF262 [Variovorax sp. PDC80]|uniref:DUF262 domain-containing protein n=1 Tax=Variovorax sp. PDC80 TaxID=1882827 RepID=UPI0008E5384F|nr:DUF262 domain-containing protein [Variovorax sp. PDC80]SFO05674.1 Protein of unknown function DUF262 [Variovorax sp. PDC80]